MLKFLIYYSTLETVSTCLNMKIDKAIFTNQFGVPLPSDNPYVALHDFVYDLEVAIPEDEFEAFKEQLANPRNSCM